MSWARIIDPLLMVSALSLGVYLTQTSDAPTQDELDARENNVLSAFAPEDIVEIRWTHPHEFSLVRNPKGSGTTDYFLGTGGTLEADKEAVRSLLRLLDLASFKRTLGQGVHLNQAQLGFEGPRLELSVLAGPRSFRLIAGAKAPSPPNCVYFKVEGTNVDTRVGVLEESLIAQLQKSQQEFLGGLVFPLARSETAKLAISHDNETFVLTPDEDVFSVQISNEPPTVADRELVDLIFFQLARTKIETYLNTPPTDSMLITIEQTSASGVSYLAKLGAPCPDDPRSIIVHRTQPSEAIGCTDRSILAALMVDGEKLRSRRATEMNPDEIDHATLHFEDRAVDLIRNGHDYALLSERQQHVPKEAGDELLETLATAGHTLVNGRPEDARRVGKVTLKGQLRNTVLSREKDRTDHAYEAHLDVFSSGDALFLHRPKDDSWLRVAEDNKWPYLAHSGWAQERNVSTFSVSELEEVTVTLSTGASWTVRRGDEGFLLGGPPHAPADPSLARELFEQLASLEALRFLTPPLPRPAQPLLHLNFQVQSSGTTKTHDLWVGGRVRGGYRAWSDLASGTFVLPYGLRSLLERPLVDRRPLRIDLDEQAQVEIKSEGRTFLFEREAGLMRASGGEATEDMIEPLAQALLRLRVVSAAGDHPAGKSISRGRAVITVQALSKGAEGRTIELRIGQATVWQGLSCRTAWIEGEDETFFVEQASLEELSELL